MKKIKISGKLGLNKEMVSKLNSEQLNSLIGGDLELGKKSRLIACPKTGDFTCWGNYTTHFTTPAGCGGDTKSKDC